MYDKVIITIGAVEMEITTTDARQILSRLYRNRDDVICTTTERATYYTIAGVVFKFFNK